MTRRHRRAVSRSRARRVVLALAVIPLGIATGPASALAQPVPFDSLHCHRVRDSRLHEAALQLIARDEELPERCELAGRAVLACVPARIVALPSQGA